VKRTSAIRGGDDGEHPTVEVPLDVKERSGRARRRWGTVEGTEFRTTVAVNCGRYYLGSHKELFERDGIDVGDAVRSPWSSIGSRAPSRSRRRLPRRRAGLAGKSDFDALSLSHRREYANWIADVKRHDTRKRRRGRPWRCYARAYVSRNGPRRMSHRAGP
jgi:hypothetical protein